MLFQTYYNKYFAYISFFTSSFIESYAKVNLTWVFLCIRWEQFIHASLIVSLYSHVYCDALVDFMNEGSMHVKVLV